MDQDPSSSDQGLWRPSSQPQYAAPDGQQAQFATSNQNFGADSPEPFNSQHLNAFQQLAQQGFQFQGHQQDVYNHVPANYERVSPVEAFAANAAGPSSTLQQFQTLSAEGASVLQRAQVMQGFALQIPGMPVSVAPVEAQVVSVASSSDLTVTQVTGQGHATSSSVLPQPSTSMRITGGQLPYMVNTVESLTEKPSCSSEATGVVIQHGGLVDSETDEAVSSLTIAIDEHTSRHKRHEVLDDQVPAEPDTTQEDTDFDTSVQDHVAPKELDEAASHLEGLDSTVSDVDEDDGATSVDELMRRFVKEAQETVDHMSSAVSAGQEIPEEPSTSGIQQSMSEEEGKEQVQLPEENHQNDQMYMLVQLPPMEDPKPRQEATRKSERIANQDRPSSPLQRPSYVPRHYNPNELWCEECQEAYTSECPRHMLVSMSDKIVLSRAWASLPPALQILRFHDIDELGIFAKRSISKRTQFGPFVAELVEFKEALTNSKFVMQVERDNQTLYLETSDENKCNWMMFVRPATNFTEQNLVAYQHGADIYFTAIKNIDAKQELKVWYAAHYANHIGARIHSLTDEDKQALDEEDMRWQCYECTKKFRTSAQLQRHLVTHEEGAGGDNAGLDNYESDADFNGDSSKRRRKGIPLRMRVNRRTKLGRKSGDGEGGTVNYLNWKKRTTNMYLNKYKKYQKPKAEGEPFRKIIRSLYEKKDKESGGKEWVCTHCDLTFDNASLLNLHTLTHAAEDVGLEEIRKITNAGDLGGQEQSQGDIQNGTENSEYDADSLDPLQGFIDISPNKDYFPCPVCNREFKDKHELINHAAEHARTKRSGDDPTRPFKCMHCWKAFGKQEKLQQHMMVHGSDDAKPLPCTICEKRFMNNSALSCHMKTHSANKYYQCPICREGFDQAAEQKRHIETHAVNGVYTCPYCSRSFFDLNFIKKHMRAFHSEKKYPCPHCDKVLPRPDKLKLHLLKHSDHREFMCESCGRQFKRKDKLKEHKKRMHSAEREAKVLALPSKHGPVKKFIPKVSPHEYHRFIYKCHQCLIGFKRRGMLVNHLAKQHPDTKPESVPELNLPILKTQRDYYCQYCDKVYKSSSKRKAHIIKNHPGASLPASSRLKDRAEAQGIANPTYSHTVGSITTVPHPCEYCHKQYASKAKLLQHQRKKHPELVPALPERQRMVVEQLENAVTEQQVAVVTPTTVVDASALPTADLLTQAMTELTQTLNEYRPQEYTVTPRTLQGGGQQQTITVHTIQPISVPVTQGTTLELSHLGQALAHTQFQGQPIQIASVTQANQTLQPTIVTATVGPVSSANEAPQQQQEGLQQVQQASTVQLAYIPRSWATNANFQNFR